MVFLNKRFVCGEKFGLEGIPDSGVIGLVSEASFAASFIGAGVTMITLAST